MKLAYLFMDVSMSNGHKGLGAMLRKKLSKGETAVFVNKKWSALKLLTSDGFVLHKKQPDNRPIVPETIKYLPYCVEGGKLNYTKALTTVMQRDFKRKGYV